MNRRAFCQLAALSAAGAWVGCSAASRSKPAPLVFIVMDTVRHDHTSAYGYGRRTTPNLELLLPHATRYERAIAPAPWTLPSHASMFTGLYPFQHQTHTFFKVENGQPVVSEPPLPEPAITVAEVLSDAGYATSAFTANTVYMQPRYNLQQGFGEYFVEHLPGKVLNTHILKWLDAQRRSSAPFFLFINYCDAHFPYNTKEFPGLLNAPPSQDPDLLKKLVDACVPGSGPPPRELVQGVTDQFDTGIANADAAVAEVVAALKQNGVYDECALVVTSDHGEFLGEHGLVAHSQDVYEEVLHVPLVVKLPNQRSPEQESRLTSLVDMPKKILPSMGKAAAQATRHLGDPGAAGGVVMAENYYSRQWHFGEPYGDRFKRTRAVLYQGPWKYIHSSDNAHELYDVIDDPHELRNLLENEPEVARQLQGQLRKANPSIETEGESREGNRVEDLSPEMREQMKALGYL
jgi:arylsulfatase A-like enzyme